MQPFSMWRVSLITLYWEAPLGYLTFMFMILFVGTSLLIMSVSLPLIFGKVKPNTTYGVRTAETLRDEEIWYRGNAYGGRVLFLTGGIQLVAVILLYLIPAIRNNFIAYNAVCGAVIVGSLLLASAWIVRHVRSL